jgi:hypothetical protein
MNEIPNSFRFDLNSLRKMEDSATARSGKRKRSRVDEEERREARVAQDLADPRWKKIRVHRASGGRKKWKSGVVIGGKRGKVATRGASGSASLVLYEDGEERVEDLDAVEWEERGSSAAQAQSSAGATTSRHSSKYRGVSWHKANKKWTANIRVDGKQNSLGSFSDEIAAARTYDVFVIANKVNKPLNFPGDAAAKGHVVTLSTTSRVRAARKKHKNAANKWSRFRGVSWHKARKQWQVRLSVGGKQKFISYSTDEVEAAHAYDAHAIANGIETPRNFPNEAEDEVVAEAERRRAAKKRKRSASKSSRFRGVSWSKSTKKWAVRIKVRGKSKNLGYFVDEVEAAHAYDAHAIANGFDAPRNLPNKAGDAVVAEAERI